MAPEIPQPQQGVVEKREQAEKRETVDKRSFNERFRDKYLKWSEGIEQKKDSSGQEDLEGRAETKSDLPAYDIFGFENEIKSMENFLLDRKVYKEFKSLVILGEYGVGKTALCQKIFNHEKVKSVYAPRIWVSMYTNKEKIAGEDNRVSVLRRILKGLGVEQTMVEVNGVEKPLLDFIREEAIEEASNNQEHGETDTAAKREISALLYALHLNLRWKKYLIVFDDVRAVDDWNEMLQYDEKELKKDKKWGEYLADGFPKGSGGRVIYTTREEALAKELVAKEHEIHRLWPLTDTQSVWKIYEASVREIKDREPPRNDKKCYDELMNKSRGLPLAVRLLGKLDPVFLDDEKTDEKTAEDSIRGAAEQGEQANQANAPASG